jgi:hypothetical protein
VLYGEATFEFRSNRQIKGTERNGESKILGAFEYLCIMCFLATVISWVSVSLSILGIGPLSTGSALVLFTA